MKAPFVKGSDETGMECKAVVRNILFDLTASKLFYILDQICSTDGQMTKPIRRLLSFYASVLGAQAVEEGRLISTWWAGSDGTGPQVLSATCQDHKCTLYMDLASGMTLSKSGSQLIVSGYHSATPPGSWLTTVNTETGERSYVRVQLDFATGIALDPDMTTLFVATGLVLPPRILSSPVTFDKNGDLPSQGLSTPSPLFMFDQFQEWETSSIYFGPHSFPSDGRCLYFVDRKPGGSVWALNRSSNAVNLVAGSGLTPQVLPLIASPSNVSSGNGSSSNSKIVMSNALNVSFGQLCDLAVTEDGLIIFVSEIDTGLVRWIELGTPCGFGRRATDVIRYLPRPGSAVYGLAIGTYGKGLVLLLGTDDGHVFQLSINRSALDPSNNPYAYELPGSSSAPDPDRSHAYPSLSSPLARPGFSDKNEAPRIGLVVSLVVGISLLSLLLFFGIGATVC
ncbi:hypothetical protein CBR_g44428 [Chara braunii]|uniref:Uncharacterized protein n=1 Tax=Chara braunii TaxID=69332 RepID=A0A388LXC8_CHABU|nr:hypothetical protein CBR_g44428 [Chara braunii]|eukprot:GBG86974.1 hypothetical protein CBR_g44428 [Chara braunii]